MMALFERIARRSRFPGAGSRRSARRRHRQPMSPENGLYALASRNSDRPADRYSVLAAPTAADRLAALSEAVDSVAAVIEFQLSQ